MHILTSKYRDGEVNLSNLIDSLGGSINTLAEKLLIDWKQKWVMNMVKLDTYLALRLETERKSEFLETLVNLSVNPRIVVILRRSHIFYITSLMFFRRLLGLARPGDGLQQPTLQFSYHDQAQPFRIEASQRIQGSQYAVNRRVWDAWCRVRACWMDRRW